MVEAPVEWLVAGMGDALATWFEAEAAYKGRRTAIAGGVSTLTALKLAQLCYELLMENGEQAVQDAAQARRHSRRSSGSSKPTRCFPASASRARASARRTPSQTA